MDGKSNLINRLKGSFLIGLFILGMLAVGVPVQAHFTLGGLTGTYPYHTNDFDPHVPGVIGYVWPGSGACAYLGYPNQANTNGCGPGYQAPYPNGNLVHVNDALVPSTHTKYLQAKAKPSKRF